MRAGKRLLSDLLSFLRSSAVRIRNDRGMAATLVIRRDKSRETERPRRAEPGSSLRVALVGSDKSIRLPECAVRRRCGAGRQSRPTAIHASRRSVDARDVSARRAAGSHCWVSHAVSTCM